MTKDSILAAAAAASRPVPFSHAAWGDELLYLRPFKASERRDIFEWQKVYGAANVYQILFVRGLCDESGNRTFADDDAPLVATFPAAQVEIVVEKILEMNRMGQDEGKAPSPTTPS